MKRTIYISPQSDCLGPLLAVAQSARKVLRVAAFTFHIPALTDVLIAKHQAGVDVGCIFDGGQALSFPAMTRELARLKAAGVPYVVGTSPKHKIMHLKVVVADTTIVFGSCNLTTGSQQESNVIDVETNAKIAAQLLAAWQNLHDWIALNQPQGAVTAIAVGEEPHE